MAVNGIGNYNVSEPYTTAVSAKEKTAENVAEKAQETTSAKKEEGVVYEKSDVTVKTQDSSAIVAQLKLDQEERDKQFRQIVLDSISKQGTSFAFAKGDDIWKFLADGNFTVDEATQKKAQEDISEDGYWGVKATSDRILDFAKALTGNDPSKIKEMKDAFQKGFDQATKTWGKELPSISQQTYKAVMDKFDAWEKEASGKTDTSAAADKEAVQTDVSTQINGQA